MKNLVTFAFAALLSLGLSAQIKTPAASPTQKIEQNVGLSSVTLEYSRPSMKGRTIFGDLVPNGKLWRTGANANTKITFADDVIVGGSEVKAGTYAIFAKPNVKMWDVMLYSDATNWGTPEKWDDSKVVATVSANVINMPMNVETFTMSFDDITTDSVNLGIMWANTYVAVPVKFHTDKMVSASIDNVMSGPAANDYYSAAVYYLEAGKDINKAKMWIDKAVELREKPAFWYHRQQSLIYAKAGDKKGALKAAKTSLKLAEEAKNADYVALNEKSIQVWEGRKTSDK